MHQLCPILFWVRTSINLMPRRMFATTLFNRTNFPVTQKTRRRWMFVFIWYAWNNAGLTFQKCYLKALHCIGSLNLFWFCFEVIFGFGRSELFQLRGRYHYLIIQVLIYIRKSTFYRRVEEWNWWWSRIIKFSYTIVYLCQDIATISELFLLLLSCTKGALSVIICFAINT